MDEPIKEEQRNLVKAMVSKDLLVTEVIEAFLCAMSLKDPTANVRLNITYPRAKKEPKVKK